jgi:hypothetical protein
MDAGREWPFGANEVVDMTAFGLHSRQMFIMTSYVESRDMREANVYCWVKDFSRLHPVGH